MSQSTRDLLKNVNKISRPKIKYERREGGRLMVCYTHIARRSEEILMIYHR